MFKKEIYLAFLVLTTLNYEICQNQPSNLNLSHIRRKRFLELHPRKSSRIENLKRRKEEESQYLEKYKRALSLEGTDSEEEVAEVNAKKAKKAR